LIVMFFLSHNFGFRSIIMNVSHNF
jgi:hypothetical protein